ncbi:MAG: aspartate carbamoyltransferase catalytic subunit [Pseudomonadota bacterium]
MAPPPLRHFTDIASLGQPTIFELLDRSLVLRRQFDDRKYPAQTLVGKLQYNLFYENSTRTNLSFEVAAKRLGAMVSMVPVAASSVHKGESLTDTVLTLAAQGADILVLRATEPGTIHRAIAAVEAEGYPTHIINAGEGALGHPTQGLLDAGTVLHALGRTAKEGLRDITLTIAGDILHSRVAASAIEVFAQLGTTIKLVGPPSLLPPKPPKGVKTMHKDLESGLHGADIVMTLRIQKERMQTGLGLSEVDYHHLFGVTHETLKAAKPNAFVMHPGPMNRGVEIDDAVADDMSRSLIRSQVTQGVVARMAVLEWLHQHV